MLELILLTGTIVAMSLGCTLIALTLRRAVHRSRGLRKPPHIPARVSIDAAGVADAIRWDLAVRGYDTPELCREDMLARGGSVPDEDRF
jgi:hypothetical protein